MSDVLDVLGVPTVSRVGAVRQSGIASLLSSGFGTVARLGRYTPLASGPRHSALIERNVSYGPLPLVHSLDIYRPDRPGPHPVVLYVHGGGFRSLSKDSHWIMGLKFAQAGFVVFNINYRLAPAHKFPAAPEDVSRAWAWVQDHAAAHDGDPTRVVLAGESAGGNLVTALTAACVQRRPEPWASEVFERGVLPIAIVPACGILQVSDPGRFSRERKLPLLVQDIINNCATVYLDPALSAEAQAMADPLVVFERMGATERPLPPFYIPCAKGDPLAPDSERLGAAIARLGGRATVRLFDDDMHAFHALVWKKAARECWVEMLDFAVGAARG